MLRNSWRWVGAIGGTLLLGACSPGVFEIGETTPWKADPDPTIPPGTDDTAASTDDTGGGDDAGGGDDTGTADGLDWEAFTADREAALVALREPILDCVSREDNGNAAFDGCYDWHSSVHGHWALLTLGRLLDEPAYVEAAERSFTAEDLEQELSQVSSPRWDEVPYGYAWLLLLARERAAGGDEDLRPLALAAADVLLSHLEGLSASSFRSHTLADDYANTSWALLNLWRWAEAEGDVALAQRTESLVTTRLLPLDEDCPLEAELRADNFFPACLMRAHTLLEVLDADAAAAWWPTMVAEDYPITPVTDIRTAHLSGLNFSRTWGMWSLYLATGDTRWRDRVEEHLRFHVSHPEYWATDYLSYSHWVPQFGVYALALTLDQPGPP